ncbi:GINS complex, Sld5 component [Auriscalpium vulgare]|uniref:GINS complex, Sld5 component n=1 Tax=Auriscalpium vulgare TaxID=40419 RepID=A0ACB8S4T8_9AGAM|nr:GINS complex, Sld5 component [Auriscalpium vulgare]
MPDFDAEPETPLQQLIRHWMNERHAPDILPWQGEVLDGLLNHINRQSTTVNLLRGDPDSSEDEHFRIVLAQTEIERVKFVVRSYIRTRLYKIEKYARYVARTPQIQERLSQAELQHAQTFAKLTEDHFSVSVLQALPEHQRSLEDASPFTPPMITEPDKSRAVFVHALNDCPAVRLPDGTTLEIKKGYIVLTPYAVVEELLAFGSVELV